MFDAELESFKTIDIRLYAGSHGYVPDKAKSSRSSAVMRHMNGDKVVISKKPDGHWTYFSVRDDRDHGTIIDWVKHRKGLNLGGVRKELRAWVGMAPNTVPQLPALSSTIKDRQAVQSRCASMSIAHRHPYLENERGIPSLTLQYWRFAGCIKIDRHGNAVFPHEDSMGICGYELRGPNYRGFSAGGSKALWLSKASRADRRLVLTESAIDSLSHASIFDCPFTRYASVGGKLNPVQPELIRFAIERMPEGSEVVAAMDADPAGRDLARAVEAACAKAGRQTTFLVCEPAEGAKDWNDVLRTTERPKARPTQGARPF